MFARNGGEAPRRERRQLVPRILFEWGTGYSGFGLFGPPARPCFGAGLVVDEKRGKMAVDCGERVADVEGLLCASRSGLWDREYAGRDAHPQLDRYLCHRREAA